MNFFNIKWIATLLLLAGLLTACRQQPSESEGVVIARVGEDKLTRQEAFAMIPDFILAEDTTQALASYKQDWVRRKIILQEAERLELHERSEVKRKLQRAREEVLKTALRDQVLGSMEKDINVSQNEAQTYYEANKDRFVLNERYVRFRHLITNTLGEARQAKNELLGGVEWKEVVEKYGINKQRSLERSSKFYPISAAFKNNSPLQDYLEVIGMKEISPIRRIGSRYHFVQLMEQRSEGDHPEIDGLLANIQEWLELSRRRKHFNSYVQNLFLKAEANNEIEMNNVDSSRQSPADTSFNYSNIKSNYKDSLTN